MASRFIKIKQIIKFSESNGDQIPKSPGKISKSKYLPIKNLKKLLVKGLTKNQILILYKVSNNGDNTITAIIYDIYKKQKIPISTLKLNAKMLKDFGLISYGSTKEPKTAELTELGMFLIEVLRGDYA